MQISQSRIHTDVDDNLKTSWQAEGAYEWIQYNLESGPTAEGSKNRFLKGTNRVYNFDVLVIETGTDGTWTVVGDKLKSENPKNWKHSSSSPSAPVL